MNVVRKISFQTVVFARNLDKRQSRYRQWKTVDFTLLTWTLVINFYRFAAKNTRDKKSLCALNLNFESGEGPLRMSGPANGVPAEYQLWERFMPC